MAANSCTEHPEVSAVFTCDGCGRLLCPDCTREGHRLIFCVHCGERAIALVPSASSVVPERHRAAKLEHPYSRRDALAYAFRGHGRLMLPAYATGLTLASLVPIYGGLFSLLVVILLPGLLFEIVRTTSTGETELPEWPDFSDFFDRVREGVWLLVIYLLGLVPSAFFFYMADCDLLASLGGTSSESCHGPVLGGIVVGVPLATFAFGATGTHSSGWLTFRIDLHLRAILSRAGPDGMKAAAFLALFLIVGRIVDWTLGGVPLIGTAISATISGYGMFTAAHVVGLVFRRHGQTLDAIYRD